MERAQFARLTKRALPIAGVFLVLLFAGLAIQKGAAWLKQRRENRQYLAVSNLTPDRLIARCGQPAEDATHDMYPMISREMRYSSPGGRNVVLAFSRTAEEGSGWVFLSIKDAQNDLAYDTPSAQIAALPCLDSTK
ncbi:MAG TPA: hypothetical protein VHE23_04080 [Candidatus Acidoferrales bacterium]|nr:hypothetical protein [Candidatus Acidoferrales bacterium]